MVRLKLESKCTIGMKDGSAYPSALCALLSSVRSVGAT